MSFYNEMKEYLISIGGIKIYYKNGDYITEPYVFEVEEGWYPLIKNLIEELLELGWNREISQVKEKFGGLRFYINDGSKEIYELISKYENLSYEICETCGEEGKLRTDLSWHSTLCDKHYQRAKNMKYKLSFDFDGTLSRKDVQEFAKELNDLGYEVWIVTSRQSDEFVKENNCVATQDRVLKSNEKLFLVADDIGIPKNRIKFTNSADKIDFLKNKGFIFHLDDDTYELMSILDSGDICKPVNVDHYEWKETILEILNNLK